MKLIDADALKIVSIGRKNGRKFVHADITDAPPIDAIPVEWLRDVMLHGESEESKIAWKVLKMWQKEQEGT